MSMDETKLDQYMETVTTKNLVEELADDYSKYFKVDRSEAIKHFDNSIEENLVLLEDFCSTLDGIRNSSTACLEHLLPTIAVKSKEMENLYSNIDNLGLFVKTVKDQVDRMDDELIKAEQCFASRSRVKKFITSLLLSNSKTKYPYPSTSTAANRPAFGFNDIFKTKDYLIDRFKHCNECSSNNFEPIPDMVEQHENSEANK